MTLTQAIGRFLAATGPSGTPREAAAIVATGFTDCIAVLILGLREPVSRIVAQSIGARPDLKALVRLQAVADLPAPDLALLYGTAAHALDYDDTGLAGHPSAVLVPAILAEIAETRADGAAMIAAYAAGYEVWADLIRRDADQHHRKGWHPSAVFGAVAAAAAAAVLRRLTADEASRAIGIAASMAGGVVANFGSMTKPFHLGRAAQSGLLAARLAQAGMTAAADAIEHDLGFLRAISPNGRVDTRSEARLGDEWRILKSGVNIKLYPMCYAAHRIIDATIDLRTGNDLHADDITFADVELGDNQASILRNHRPQNALDAKFSAEFAIAAAAIAGRCTQTELTDEFVRRAPVQEFFGKVRLYPNAEKDKDEPALAPFDRVTLRLKDGRSLTSDAVAYPRGHFRRGVPREALWQKFSDCTRDSLTADESAQLFARLQDLQNYPASSPTIDD